VINNNPNGRIAVYANTNGIYYGKRIVEELNQLITGLPSEEGGLEVELKVPKITDFPNSMFKVEIGEDEKVRGEDAFLVQWFPQPPFDPNRDQLTAPRNKDEFFQTIAALHRAGVKRLTLVTPYLYDQRKDTVEGKDSVLAALFCQHLYGTTHGERMQGLCLDVHSPQIIGFYQMANVQMNSVPIFRFSLDYLRKEHPETLENAAFILPDVGSVKRSITYLDLTNLPGIIINKRRTSPTETRIEAFFPPDLDLEGRSGLLGDDILASGGTAGDASRYAQELKIRDVYFLMTHPELTDIATLDRMHEEGLFVKAFVGDMVDVSQRDYLVPMPTAKLTARLIYNIHSDQSIGPFLKKK